MLCKFIQRMSHSWSYVPNLRSRSVLLNMQIPSSTQDLLIGNSWKSGCKGCKKAQAVSALDARVWGHLWQPLHTFVSCSGELIVCSPWVQFLPLHPPQPPPPHPASLLLSGEFACHYPLVYKLLLRPCSLNSNLAHSRPPISVWINSFPHTTFKIFKALWSWERRELIPWSLR